MKSSIINTILIILSLVLMGIVIVASNKAKEEKVIEQMIQEQEACLKKCKEGGGGICSCFESHTFDKKPVIYLYPIRVQDTRVQLDYHGTLIADYPKYDENIKGWNVTALPDGKIINKADNKEYSYLFWEGIPNSRIPWNLNTGFVVRGDQTREFLQEKLSLMGLTPREYNEFIVYWYPKMKKNPYNLIHFAGKEYTDTAPLTITPAPDSLLRVFMVYKPLTEKISIQEQRLIPLTRTGFTVIEWGGTMVE